MQLIIDQLPENAIVVKEDNITTINFHKECDIIVNQSIDFVPISSMILVDRGSIKIENNRIELYKGHYNSIYINLVNNNDDNRITISYKNNSYIIDILQFID